MSEGPRKRRFPVAEAERPDVGVQLAPSIVDVVSAVHCVELH